LSPYKEFTKAFIAKLIVIREWMPSVLDLRLKRLKNGHKREKLQNWRKVINGPNAEFREAAFKAPCKKQ